MNDRFELQRFVDAQAEAYDRALDELRHGEKTSHWMWFVFPQIAGLGHSPMARRYAITSLDEARAFLDHPILGDRLRTATAAMNAHAGRSALVILGSPDDLKFQSCMTLFSKAAPGEAVFSTALATFFDGGMDTLTLTKLRIV